MKKYFSLIMLAFLGGLFLTSCERSTEVVDNDTYSVVYDIRENFVKSSTSNSLYGINKTFNTPLYSSDVVLIYRQDGSSLGNPIWKLLPKTYYLTQGELDYTFDFTRNDIQIYANGNFDLSAQDTAFKNSYLNDQIFRVVIVPASMGTAKSANAINIDYSDYNTVINHFNIDDSKVSTL